MIRNWIKLSRQLVKQRNAIAKDLRLVVQNSIYIPNICRPILGNPTDVKSELNPLNYTSKRDWAAFAHYASLPFQRRSFSEGNLTCYPDHFIQENKCSRWFFINGMLTTPQIACLNGKEISRCFGRPVNLIHTPTRGLTRDLTSSFIARTLRKDGQLSQPAYKVIKKSLQNFDHVVIICHSQGTIVSSYIVRKLQKDPETRKLLHKLELYCFAGVADSFRLDVEESCKLRRPVPYVEHFVNKRDFFARIGILAHERSTEGPIFQSNRSGHLLNTHYLNHFIKGEYCDMQSRLYQYLGGNTPKQTAYSGLKHSR